MLQLDPMQLKKILPQMQGSSTAQRNKMAEVEAKNATDLEQSRIQAGATMGAARIGADSRATAAENRPQSIDQSIAQAIEKITELEMEKARQPDSRTSAMVQSQINMWKERLKQLQASVEGRATAPAREQAAQMQRIIQGAGGPGQPVAAPTPGQGNIVRWQDLTP
jgi:DNA anti-recombination protein RmuC